MNSYDQFYDEHVHLFSLLSISKLLKKSNLRIFDVQLLSTHGGSIRFYVCKKFSKFNCSKRVFKLKSKEIKFGLNKYKTYFSLIWVDTRS